MIKNIMSVDLEDYYCDLPFSQWNKFDDRVVETTQTILKLFNKYNVRATFFVLGYIVEKYPDLIEKIKSEGHELASHGYLHKDLRKMTKEEFESDLIKSLDTIRKVSKEKVLGFRAPYFSIDKKNFWTFEIMKKYLAYDSSIFPVKTPLYGIPDAPRYMYHLSEMNPLEDDPHEKFIEIPPATLHLPILGNIPVAGGFYLRFWPIGLLKTGIKIINKSRFPAMCYIHPKDLDPLFPRIPEYNWHYYWGLKGAIKKFESLLKDFRFETVRETIF